MMLGVGMTKKTKVHQKRTSVPLIIEKHPKNYKGYPFITLIQYRKQHVLSIIDNCDDETIKAFVLDLCGPENVNEESIISVATNWYSTNKEKYPISFEFSKLGMTNQAGKIYRSFNVEFITRVIGPVPKFPMEDIKSIKRRRRKPIPPNVIVIHK